MPILGSWASGSSFGKRAGGGGNIIAEGGTVYEVVDGGETYQVHAFTTVGSSNTFTIQSAGPGAELEYLIVAGGGGGGCGWGSGGAGAGGLLNGTITDPTVQSYTFNIGDGGAASNTGGTAIGTKGQDTTAFGLTAEGGGPSSGHETSSTSDLLAGGCGGGSGRAFAGGTGSQGYPGGQGAYDCAPGYAGSGGGGMGAAGTPSLAGGTGSSNNGGPGGVGLNFSSKFGTTYGQNGWFCGGGGAGAGPRYNNYQCGGSGYSGSGGTGGGGEGAWGLHYGTNNPFSIPASYLVGKPGLANTGGGGGGGSYQTSPSAAYRSGGKGGSGIVLVRYKK